MGQPPFYLFDQSHNQEAPALICSFCLDAQYGMKFPLSHPELCAVRNQCKYYYNCTQGMEVYKINFNNTVSLNFSVVYT